jgi:hypothetical protein
MCASPHILSIRYSFSWCSRRRKSRPLPATLNVLHHALHALFLPPALPPTARSTVLRHQCVTRSRSSTSRKHSTVTASSCRRIGTVEGRSWCCATTSTRKRGARHGSAICRLRRKSTRTATTAREKCPRPSLRTKDSSTLLTHLLTSSSSHETRSQPRSHPSTTRRPNKFSLRRAMIHKNARPAQHLLPFHRCIRDASCQPRRALRLVVILGSDRRARASGDGG